jgi:hypothetical protein
VIFSKTEDDKTPKIINSSQVKSTSLSLAQIQTMKYSTLILGRLLKHCNPSFSLGSFMLFLFQLKNYNSHTDGTIEQSKIPDYSGINRTTVELDSVYDKIIRSEGVIDDQNPFDFSIAARRAWEAVC